MGKGENLYCLYKYKRAEHSKKNKTRAFALGISSSGHPSLRVNFNDKASTPTAMCRNSINLDISLSSGRSRIFLRGAPTHKSGYVNLLFCKFICQKLHENIRIWTWGASLASPLDPPMLSLTMTLSYLDSRSFHLEKFFLHDNNYFESLVK